MLKPFSPSFNSPCIKEILTALDSSISGSSDQKVRKFTLFVYVDEKRKTPILIIKMTWVSQLLPWRTQIMVLAVRQTPDPVDLRLSARQTWPSAQHSSRHFQNKFMLSNSMLPIAKTQQVRFFPTGTGMSIQRA